MEAGSDPAFVVVGDWGTGSEEQQKVALQMAKAVQAVGARFIISTGDNFYPRGVSGVDDLKWKEAFEDVYDASALDVPWYVVLGNHDHKGSVAAQIDYTYRSSRWYLPAHYYKLSEKLADGSFADFFFLDTDSIKARYSSWRPRIFEDAQVAWLERELAKSTAAWKIVVGHHPVFSGGRHKNTKALVELLQPLFERHGVQVYLNGHNHNLEHVLVGNTNYLTSGAGAKPRAAAEVDGTRFVKGNCLGFMTARLTPAAMDIEFQDENGISLYRARIGIRGKSSPNEEHLPRRHGQP